MKRVFIIHGWEGKPEGCFKPWLKTELEKQGFEVLVPAMPSTDHPKLSEWIFYLREIIGKADKDLIMVGHSLGSPTILKYLNQLQEGEKIGGAVMVAGFARGLRYDEIREFHLTPDEVVLAKKHCDKFITIFSDDDSLVPLSVGLELQKELDSELIIEKNKGHFSDEDNVFELPSALDAILRVSSITTRS